MGPRGLSAPAWLAVCLPVLVMACSGSGGLSSVQGKVLYKKAPIKGVLVTFHPKGADPITAIRPTGFTSEDGTFTLTTGQKQGAPAGEYIVTFMCPRDVAPKHKRAFDQTPVETVDFFNGAFANAKQSSYKAEIKPGANNLAPFELQ